MNSATNETGTKHEAFAIEAEEILAREGIAMKREGWMLIAPWGTKFSANLGGPGSHVMLEDRSGADIANRVRGSKRLHDAVRAKKSMALDDRT